MGPRAGRDLGSGEVFAGLEVAELQDRPAVLVDEPGEHATVA